MNRRTIALLLLLPLLWTSCKKDPNGEGPGTPGGGSAPELQGNTALNSFILAAEGGRLYQVNAQSGEESLITELDDYNDVVGFDYEAGVAIFGEEENAIQAYDVQSRTRKWRRALTVYRSATGIDITPVVKDGISFAAGDNGVVVATAIESGALKWHAILNPDFHSERDYYSVGRITVTDDYVVVGTNSSLLVGDERNAIYVLKRSDGTGMAKLTLTNGDRVTAAIRVDGDRLYVPGKNVYAIDLAEGKVIWQYDMDSNPVTSTPQLSGNMLIVQASEGVANGKLLAIDKNTGAKIWETGMGNSYAGAYDPLVVNDLVIAVHVQGSALWSAGNGRLTVLDSQSGSVRWVNEEISVGSNPVYANGVIYVYGHLLSGATDEGSGLIAIDATSGKLMWTNPAFGSASDVDMVVVAENGIYRAGYHQ